MDIQRQDAFKRIITKIEILETWLKTEIPFSLTAEGNYILDKDEKFELEYFPKSISALRNWNNTKNSSEVCNKYDIPSKTSSAKSWEAIPENIKERVTGTKSLDNLFERLKVKAHMQRDKGSLSRIKELEEQLILTKQNHAGIAHEMVALRLENDTLVEDIHTAEKKIEGIKLQYKNEIDWRNRLAEQQTERITELEKEKDNLLQQLLEVSEKTGVFPTTSPSKTNVVTFERDNK